MCSETVGLSKIKEKLQATKEKIAAKFHKETTEASPLSDEQKDYVNRLDTIKKNLTTLLSKIKSTQTEMEKAEKKHKLEGDTSLWMVFQLHTVMIASECNYFLRFVTELQTELTKYNKQASKKGEVEQTIVEYIRGAIDNFCCDGRKISIACARGVFITAMQYILQNPTCPQTGRSELNTILSGKSLQILAKNKDFSGLLEDVKTSIYSLLDILASMSLLADGNSEPEESEVEQAKSRFIHNIEGSDAVLSAMQDVIIYIKGGRLSESKAKLRLQQLAGDILSSPIQAGSREAPLPSNGGENSNNHKENSSEGITTVNRHMELDYQGSNNNSGYGNSRSNGDNRNENSYQGSDKHIENQNYQPDRDNNERYSNDIRSGNQNYRKSNSGNSYSDDSRISETSHERNDRGNYQDSRHGDEEGERNVRSNNGGLSAEKTENNWWT